MNSLESVSMWLCLVVLISTRPFVSSICPEKCECRDERNHHLENVVVDCSHAGLTSIPEFDAEESFSTWKLIMTGNPLKTVPSGAVRNLTDLVELDLTDCGIQEIKEESFAGPSRLDKLILKDNHIKELPEHMFHRHSPAISYLDLSGNKGLSLASFIKAGKYLINLDTLDLSENSIRQSSDAVIPHDFRSLTGLKFLDLSHNSLGPISDQYFDAFRTLAQLQILDLSYNNLRPSVSTFSPMPQGLEELRLAGNPHLGLQDNLRNALYGIPDNIDIRILNISDVGLTGSLKAKAFDFVRKLNLEILDLSKNRLTHIDPPDLSQKMPYIKELHLNDNRLISIKSLVHMESLRILDLSGNMLSTFPVEIFHMPELEEVYVNHNSLKKIVVPSNYKETLMQLKTIGLSKNKISTLLVEGNQQLWKQFPSLRELDLSFNYLSNVDPMNMAALGQLELLDIRHNRFSQIHNNLYTLITRLKSLGEVRINNNPFQCTCRWLEEAARQIPKTVLITGLARTVCRTDNVPKTHAPTVAGFADGICHVHLPGTPKVRATNRPKEVEAMNAEASTKIPSSGGLSPGVTAVIVLVVLGAVVGVGVLLWKHGHRIKGHFAAGQMSYTEILDEYHPPNGGGVPL